MAEEVLDHIQGELRRGKPLPEVLAIYLPPKSKPAQIQIKLQMWLHAKERQMETGDLSPRYIRELRRYCKPQGNLARWHGRSI